MAAPAAAAAAGEKWYVYGEKGHCCDDVDAKGGQIVWTFRGVDEVDALRAVRVDQCCACCFCRAPYDGLLRLDRPTHPSAFMPMPYERAVRVAAAFEKRRAAVSAGAPAPLDGCERCDAVPFGVVVVAAAARPNPKRVHPDE